MMVNKIENETVSVVEAKTPEVSRKDMFMVHPSLLVADESFNIRTDYGDIESLALSIIENGVKMPLSGYAKDGKYIVTDGFRRHRAVQRAIELGHQINAVPFIKEQKGYTSEDRLFDMLIKNDGKNLTSLEQAELFKKLIARGFSITQIAKKIGKSFVFVNDMLGVANVPQTVKNEIIEGNISTSLVAKIVSEVKADEEKVVEVIKEAKEKATSEGKQKITEKTLENNKTLAKVKNVTKFYHQINQIDSMGNFIEIVYSSNDIGKIIIKMKELLKTNPTNTFNVVIIQEDSQGNKTELGKFNLDL